jgi:hypothetical protein
MKSPVIFVSDTRVIGVNVRPGKTAVRSWAKADVSFMPQALVSLYSGRR